MQDSKSNHAHAKARGPRRRIFTGAVAVAGSAALAAAVLLPSGTALAAYQADSPGGAGTTTTATVDVSEAITLSALPGSFTLTGVPGDKPATAAGAVTYDVYTNNVSGYSVSVVSTTADLTGTTNGGVIPVGDISAEDANADGTAVAATTTTGDVVTAGAFAPLATTPGVVVHSQTGPSAATPGDVLYTNFEFSTAIPNVVSDTYTTTLDYIATEPPGAPGGP